MTAQSSVRRHASRPRSRGLTVRYGPPGTPPAVDGLDLSRRGGRGPGPARAQRGRQDQHGRDPRGLPHAGCRRRAGARPRPGGRPRARCGAASGSCSRGAGSTRCSGRAGCSTSSPRYYDDPEDRRRAARPGRPRAVAATPWRHLSGGEQQRLSLALALVGRPEVAFLDEPTAGVDPEGRIVVREVVAAQRQRGMCVLLTTHELAEAETPGRPGRDHRPTGRVVAEGTPPELTAGRRAGRLAVVTLRAPAGLDTAALAGAPSARGLGQRDEHPARYRLEAGTGRGGTGASRRRWPPSWPSAVRRSRDLRTGQTLEEAYLGRSGRRPPGGQRPRPARTPHARRRRARRGRGRALMRPLLAQTGPSSPCAAPTGRPSSSRSASRWSSCSSSRRSTWSPRRGRTPPSTSSCPGSWPWPSCRRPWSRSGIGTGFERGYGVLKRLGSTPLGRPRLLGAKIVAVVAVELLQAAVLVAVGLALGWNPGGAGARGRAWVPPSAPCCSARSPSAGSGCSWPGRSSRR